MRFPTIATVAFLSLASPLRGQASPSAVDSTIARLPRWHVGGGADIGQPIGGLKRHVPNAAGLHGHMLLRLDREGVAAIRLQGGWLNYGHESQRSCLDTLPSCRVAVNVTTANGILSLGMGPQLSFPLGPLRTYGYALVGMSRFATVSGLGGGLVPDIVGGDENFGDAGAVWSGGVGLQWPVHQRTTIDIGIAYQGHGRRHYLLEGGMTDQPDGSLAFDAKSSNANLFAISMGVTKAMSWGGRRSTP